MKDAIKQALLMNFVRVVDILIEDYEAARAFFLYSVQVTDSVPMHALILAVGHFENCITSATRAIHFAQRLRKKTGKTMIPRHVAVLASGIEDRVRGMRNAIEHLDQQLVGESDTPVRNWKPGDPFCLIIKGDRIELGVDVIEFHELAMWIRSLHKLATDLKGFKES